MGHIELVREVLVYENRWWRIYDDHVRADDPKVTRYTRIVEPSGKTGAGMLPLWQDKDGRQELGLIRIFRYPIGRETWEIPRGSGEGPTPADDATRELYEETGLTGATLTGLGPFYSNNGLMNVPTELFACTFDGPRPDAKPRDKEVIGFRWFAWNEVRRQIVDAEITDSFTLAAVARAMCRGLLS